MEQIGIGKRIKEIRGTLSLKKFASLLGVHSNTLARYEDEETYPDVVVILKICEMANVSPSFLLTGEDLAAGRALRVTMCRAKIRQLVKGYGDDGMRAIELAVADLGFEIRHK